MSVIWEFGVQSGWQKFTTDVSAAIEDEYRRRKKSVSYSAGGHMYRIVFADMKQYREDDASKMRLVRRSPSHSSAWKSRAPSGQHDTSPKSGGKPHGALRPEDEEIVYFLGKVNLKRFIPFFSQTRCSNSARHQIPFHQWESTVAS